MGSRFGAQAMTIRKHTFLAMLASTLAFGSSQLLAQTDGLSSLTTEAATNRSNEDQRGRIERTPGEQGMIGPNVENVREFIDELRGPQRQRPNIDMSVENINERRNSRRRRGRQNPPPPVHVQFQPMFYFNPPSSSQVEYALQTRLNQLLGYENSQLISVSVNNRVAILRGNVGSEYARRLLEKVLKIEPGISQVDNKIVVAPQAEPAR